MEPILQPHLVPENQAAVLSDYSQPVAHPLILNLRAQTVALPRSFMIIPFSILGIERDFILQIKGIYENLNN